MKYLKLGNTDLNISQIGIGGMSFGSAGWMAGRDTAEEILKRAIDLGINYIDTANKYSNGESEEIIGKATEKMRDEIIISTKLGGKIDDKHFGFSRKEFEYQIRESLNRLRTDYVDIYYTHTWFDSLNAGEIVSTFGSMIENGKIRYYGLSNVSGYQLAEIDSIAEERDQDRPQVVQNHYNAIYREEEREVIPYCRKKSITFSPFSPLAAGFLAGKYKRGEEPNSIRSREYPLMRKRYFHENDFDVLDAIIEVSQELGTNPASLSLSYLISKGFLPVVGIASVEHLREIEKALDINLRQEHIERIEEPYLPHALMKGTAGY